MGEDRTEKLEQQVAALQTATNYGFGKIETELAHLQTLVRETLAKPPSPTPAWLLLIAVGTMMTGLSSLIIGVVVLLR